MENIKTKFPRGIAGVTATKKCSIGHSQELSFGSTPPALKTKYTFIYRSRDGHYMRPESFLNINKGRTLSSSQLRVLGITKVKLKDVSVQAS